MKKIIIIIIVLSGALLINCSSDNVDIIEQKQLLKAYTTSDPNFTYRNEYYSYNNEFLISYNYNNSSHQYKYNGSGKLISWEIDNSHGFDYYYDSQNRLIKSVSKNTNSYTELIYENEKVTITNFHSNGQAGLSYEHFVDGKGRIVKIVNPFNQSTYRIKEYAYDDNNNIIKEILKDNSINEDREYNYEYYKTINPFYIARKKIHESIYHLVNLDGISIFTEYGTTPNVIIRENYNYTIDSFNYPSKLTINNQDIWEFKYE